MTIHRVILFLIMPSAAMSQDSIDEIIDLIRKPYIDAGCGADALLSGPDLTEEECIAEGYVCIRVENVSSFNFDRFVIHLPQEAEDFGSIEAGTVTPYRSVGCAYHRNGTEAWSGDMYFVFGVIDQAGNQFLSPGAYTAKYSAREFSEPRRGDGWILHGELLPEAAVK